MKRRNIVAIGALFMTAAGCPLALDGFTIGDPNADAGGGPDGSADARFDSSQPDTSKSDTSMEAAATDATVETGVDSSAVCDLTLDPKDSMACVNDTDGVFVDTAGNDMNNGKMATPVATLTKGLDVAKTRGIGRIYVCEGTYAEDVIVDTAHDGISIYGGFKCSAWTYSGIKPVVGKTQNPFKLDTLVKPVIVEDIETSGKDGDVNTPSSIGMFINASTNVTLKRVKLGAGVGFTGANGTSASNYTKVAPNDVSIRGVSSMGKVGGASHACMLCTDAKNSTGGGGGNAGNNGKSGTDGTPNLGGMFPNDGKGGAGDTGSGCGVGDKGAAGGAGTSAATPVSLGTFDKSGWTGAAGLGGTNGGPGQGGGGGGGAQTGNNSGGGAGAGCGGCGGGAGGGGFAAGSSIAFGVLSSTVNVITSELVAKDGGFGGAGAGGQSAQGGGVSGMTNGNGCLAGAGGTGGSGGTGAGAAGGISVGILWKGAGAPTIDATTQGKITLGPKGNKGLGGTPGTNDGPDGVAQAVLQAP